MVVQLTFSGKALENQEIKSGDLWKSVDDFVDLLKQANKILNHSQEKMICKSIKEIQAGSFGIDISILSFITLSKDIDSKSTSKLGGLLTIVEIIRLIIDIVGGSTEKIIETQEVDKNVEILSKDEDFKKRSSQFQDFFKKNKVECVIKDEEGNEYFPFSNTVK